MRSIYKTPDGSPVLVDTDKDVEFARQIDKPYYRFYYSKQGAYYAADTDRVIKLTPTDLSDAISGSELIDVDVAEQFLHTFS